MLNPEPYRRLQEIIIQDIKDALRDQGHYDTGTLEASFTPHVETENGLLVLSSSALDYIKDLEEGVPKEDIRESDIDINKLALWVTRKIGTPFPLAKAKNIVQRWKEVGKPSQAFGRLHAIRDQFDRDGAFYDGLMVKALDVDIDGQLSQIKSGTV